MRKIIFIKILADHSHLPPIRTIIKSLRKGTINKIAVNIPKKYFFAINFLIRQNKSKEYPITSPTVIGNTTKCNPGSNAGHSAQLQPSKQCKNGSGVKNTMKIENRKTLFQEYNFCCSILGWNSIII